MTDPSQPTPTPFERPSARAAGAMPMQRGNYGLPPRQAAPQPRVQVGPRSMDIMAPRPAQLSRPQPPTPPQPVVPRPEPAPAAPAPSEPTAVTEQVSVAQPTPRPLYTHTPVAEAPPIQRAQSRGLLPKARLALLIIGAVLLLGGAARWITAGSTSGDIIAAGAIAANDGNTMTVQFTATDGKMHKFTADSDRKLIPGSAVQVAYQSGAPDNGARRVEPIQAAHSMGISLMVSGIVLLVFAGLVTLLMRRQPKHTNSSSIAKPVTV